MQSTCGVLACFGASWIHVTYSVVIEVIHSRACTFPWIITAGLEPLPPLPQMWIPVRARPWTEVPTLTISDWPVKPACRSRRN